MTQQYCLGCTRCETGPTVTLASGCTVCNYCPDYKQECLARHVLSLPTKEARREFLAAWGRKHGQASADELGELVKVVYKTQQIKA